MVDIAYIFKSNSNFKQVVFYYSCNKLIKDIKFPKGRIYEKENLLSFYKKYFEETQDIVIATEGLLFLRVLIKNHKWVSREYNDNRKNLELSTELLNDNIDKFSNLLIERCEAYSSFLFMKEYINLCNDITNIEIRNVLFERLMINSFDHEKKLISIYLCSRYNCSGIELLKKLELFETAKILYGDYNQLIYNYWTKIKKLNILRLISITDKLYERIKKEYYRNGIYFVNIFFRLIINSVEVEEALCNIKSIKVFLGKVKDVMEDISIDVICKMLDEGTSFYDIQNKMYEDFHMGIYDRRLNNIERQIYSSDRDINKSCIIECRRKLAESIIIKTESEENYSEEENEEEEMSNEDEIISGNESEK
jgi:hypothetical protein